MVHFIVLWPRFNVAHFNVFAAARKSWEEYPLNAFSNAGNWSFAVDYGTGKRSMLTPNFNFCLELQENTKVYFFSHLMLLLFALPCPSNKWVNAGLWFTGDSIILSSLNSTKTGLLLV